MKLSLPITVSLTLLILIGCSRPPVFEGLLFTYTDFDLTIHDSGTLVVGTGDNLSSILDPPVILRSAQFWQTYGSENPALSKQGLNDLRSDLAIRAVKTFRFDGSLIAQWSVQIENGNQEIFRTLCSTYQLTHHSIHSQRYSAVANAIELLEARREKLLKHYSHAKFAHEKNRTIDSQSQVDFARSNLEKLDARITALQPDQSIHGQLVDGLMEFHEADKDQEL